MMEKNRKGSFNDPEAPCAQKDACFAHEPIDDDFEHKGLLKEWIHHEFEQEDAYDEDLTPELESMLARSLQKIMARISPGDRS